MTKIAVSFCCVALLVASTASAQTDRLNPVKEHEWLQKFVGQWDSQTKADVQPGQPPFESTGQEKVRALGKFWIVAEHSGEMMGTPVTSNFTLGYDPEKKKFVATWVDSMFNYLWTYDGALDAEGKTLTFETEGPNPMTGGTCAFKEVIEFQGPDERTHKSYLRGDDGEWSEMMTISYRRKK